MPAPPRIPKAQPGQPLSDAGERLSPEPNAAGPGADDDPRLAPAEERKQRAALRALQRRRGKGRPPATQPRAP